MIELSILVLIRIGYSLERLERRRPEPYEELRRVANIALPSRFFVCSRHLVKTLLIEDQQLNLIDSQKDKILTKRN
jgi:transcription initiation factor IIE alpha subunit